MHAGLLGTGKCHAGSILVYLVEASCFGLFNRGDYEAQMQERLRVAYRHFCNVRFSSVHVLSCDSITLSGFLFSHACV